MCVSVIRGKAADPRQTPEMERIKNMPFLQKITITINTLTDDLNDDTVLHVFVRNRKSDTSRSIAAADYITNLLSFQRHETAGPWEINPYLGFGQALALGTTLKESTTSIFDIPLRSAPIPFEEVVLPVVDIHIISNPNDRWIFDYHIDFLFDDGKSFGFGSNDEGATGIILDEENRNYSGICTENPDNPQPPPVKFESNPVITLEKVLLKFYTHNNDDDNKDNDTVLNVHIINRLGAGSAQDIAVGLNLCNGEDFPEDSIQTIEFSQSENPLASNSIRLQDIIMPVVYITIAPNGNDRWAFDYQVTYCFSNGQEFTSRTNGVILDQDYRKHSSVYQGSPFPTLPPPGKATLSGPAVVHFFPPKMISLNFLQTKLDEFINKRTEPPLRKIRLHNTGPLRNTLPESYYDLQSIVANPPPPGVLSSPDFVEGVKYNSNPTTISRQSGVYFDNINSKSLNVHVDPGAHAPLVVELDFDCTGPQEIVSENAGGIGSLNLTKFTVRISLTLTFIRENPYIDLMSWVDDLDWRRWTFTKAKTKHKLIATGMFLGQQVSGQVPEPADNFFKSPFAKKLEDSVIDIIMEGEGGAYYLGNAQAGIRDAIFDAVTQKDPFTDKTIRDQLNETVNSWLLGGVITGDSTCTVLDNICTVLGKGIDNGLLEIAYNGPQHTFVFQEPPDWPSPTNTHPAPIYDFSPGNLNNIDHIIVLTMENRSFDSMLGFLSLPLEKGGMGRTDVDGLKGTEFNLLNGEICPSLPFPPDDTIFSPDPPHDYEPVQKAINGGKMDGFVQSFSEQSGPAAAHRIMWYHTPANLPVYDALVRDFAVGHRWFASHPGETFPNRFYELTGRLNIDPKGFWEFNQSNPLRPVFTPTIFDYLSEGKVSWKYFEHHYCFLRFFEKLTFDAEHIVAYDDPLSGFVSLARSGNLPSVCFIDPHFIEFPPGGNCDGSPADVKAGQMLVKQVVETVITSPQWNKTLLLITYDEHGGFYDHFPPPVAVKVSPDAPGTYGVRVPAFVISPWVKGESVFGHDGIEVGGGAGGANGGTIGGANSGTDAPVDMHGATAGNQRSLYFDHTSILKTIVRRFLNKKPPYMGPRYAAANDLSAVIGNQLRASQFLPFIPYNLLYIGSQMRLEVQGGSATPGTVLVQNGQNDTNRQQFSFEDAGGGYFYIRTHTGNLYLTADLSLGVKQDVKYPPNGSAATGNPPKRQHWKLSSNSVIITENPSLAISNAAFPGKVLQPSSSNGDAQVVLGTATVVHGGGIGQTPNAWQVTSPLLPKGPVVSHP